VSYQQLNETQSVHLILFIVGQFVYNIDHGELIKIKEKRGIEKIYKDDIRSMRS